MSTIVCQNLVSCFDFESQLTETTTTLKLRVAAAPPPASPDTCRRSDDHHSLDFLRAANSQESSSVDSYTHPLSKNSPYSKLTPKSLQLCTENLGSETGSDTASDCSSIFSASPPLSPASNSADDRKTFDLDDCRQKKPSPWSQRACRKINTFPPPLTTMSGGSSLQVRRHTEGGRLIVEAVEGPFRNSYLHAERSGGRLKLSFATPTPTAAYDGGEQEQEQEEEEEEEEGNLNECGGSAAAEIEEPRNEIESEKEEMETEGDRNLIEKFQRYRRCNESGHGNKGLCSNWKPALWVATS